MQSYVIDIFVLIDYLQMNMIETYIWLSYVLWSWDRSCNLTKESLGCHIYNLLKSCQLIIFFS